MKIQYKNKRICKVCTNANTARKEYGENMAKKIQQRIGEITAADSVELLVRFHIGRCHSLSGNRAGQYDMDLVHPYRLIFVEIENEIEIQVVEVQEITDYH